MNYESEEVWFPCSLDVLGWDESFHDLMLNDRLRMAAYEEAIRRAVRPGMVVLDVGTGTGILARWALEAGAARVYGIEVNGRILEIAKSNMHRAGVADRFKPINALSYDVVLPEKVDLIISEIIGNIGDNEDCARILADARDRFLKPRGKMLPERLSIHFVPVASPAAHAQIERGVCKAVSAVQDLQQLLNRLGVADPFELYYDVVLPRSRYLGLPRQARTIDFRTDPAETAYALSLTFPATADGLLTGFKGYFIAQLTDRDLLDISGDDPKAGSSSDSWKHCYLPLARPLPVRAGDIIRFDLERRPVQDKASPFSCRYRWRAEVATDAGQASARCA
jgi:protein arginine N-methyltransferase 1